MAKVLEVSLDYLMGLTETDSPVTELLEELASASGEGRINKIIKKLPKDKQEQVLTFAEFLLVEEQKSKSNREFEEWVSTTETLMRRLGANGESSFLALLAAERPDLAEALGIGPKKKSV
jgi:hypothetical protein